MIIQPTSDVSEIAYSDDLKYTISEIFYSVQGEGTRAGLPCVFVRLQGCTLRCTWCDTKYALDFREGGLKMTAGEISDRIRAYQCSFIEFTGGEPLEQPNIYPLMKYLCDEEYTVALETGGHINSEFVDERVIRIIDIKCPGSKMHTLNYYPNLDHLRPHDEVKFVIANESDYDFARDILLRYSLSERCASVLFSPSFYEQDFAELTSWILRDHLPVRLQMQMHKFIWSPETRGV